MNEIYLQIVALIFFFIIAIASSWLYYDEELKERKIDLSIDIVLDMPDAPLTDAIRHMMGVACAMRYPDYGYGVFTVIKEEENGNRVKYPSIKLHYGKDTRDFKKLIILINSKGD